MIPLLGKVPGGVTLQRFGATTYSAGRPVFPTPVDVLIEATVFVKVGTRLSSGGDGIIYDAKVISYSELRPGDETTEAQGDHFVHDGKTYRIQTSIKQPAFLGIQPVHWEAGALEVAALPMPEGP